MQLVQLITKLYRESEREREREREGEREINVTPVSQ